MNKYIGKVIEVYFPEQFKKGQLIDVMERTITGFKVDIDGNIKDIVVEDNDSNSEIMKDDIVVITEDGNNTTIELLGDDYE